jgi:predicted small integral membrane protein
MDFEWMAWTVPTAVFFITIAVMLAGMAVWEVVSPTIERKGFLPISTTRGDRLFIGLLGSGYIAIAWMGLTDWNLYLSIPVYIGFIALMIRYG